MSTQITTLIENNQDPDRTLMAEHGLSFFIHHGGTNILFDTGQSDKFLANADTLKVDLSTVHHVVLSHGHYDHTDGFPHLVQQLERKGTPPGFTLNIHRAFFDPKYSSENGSLRYIGCGWDRQWATSQSFTLNYVEGRGTTLAPGVHLVTAFDRTHPLEVHNPRFVVSRVSSEAAGTTAAATQKTTARPVSPDDPTLEIDDFRDEQAIVLETPKGLVVLVGCSHPGIMNMLDTVRSRFTAPIFAVLGGTHLVEARGERLEEALDYLSDEAIPRVGPSHCTGEEAMNALARRNPRFFPNVSGTTLTVD
jgi:7,8-dihydropterin-6-yl-methyl-4-(beta-D-ribofuranosyl)aminobenzene 5'-phosphate synthase